MEMLAGIDLAGRRVVVTGASGGIGLATAEALASRGATVIAGVRRPIAATALAAVPGVDIRLVDLADLASVRDFCLSVLNDYPAIDLVIANAGIMACPQATTRDGFELQFGTNHLGHFVLVNQLIPALVRGVPSRVVVVSSAGHGFADVDLDDPGFAATTYDSYVAYGRSKTANILFAVELDRRLRGSGVRAAAVNPGLAETSIFRHLSDTVRTDRLRRAESLLNMTVQTPEQAAATSVWAGFLADADEIGGRYCQDCAPARPTKNLVKQPGVLQYALDGERARELWELSERLVGETFGY
jgi:NAD(P)-dependent dehydrogenase (short-subunit alcohol dehydrogenase family)